MGSIFLFEHASITKDIETHNGRRRHGPSLSAVHILR